MAAKIQIKRSGTQAAPGTLALGELAYSWYATGGNKLYIAKDVSGTATIVTIGGEYYTNLLDHTLGTLTASAALLVDSNKKLDNLKVDNLDFDGSAITSITANSDITITPNGTGDLVLDGLNWPQADGSAAGEVLVTDGSNQLSWATNDSDFSVIDNAAIPVSKTFNTSKNLTFAGSSPITTAVTEATGHVTVTISASNASTSAVGVASFSNSDFGVTTGVVTIKASGVSNNQLGGSIANAKLANSDITVGTTTISLGGTATSISGVDSLTVDDITINGDAITIDTTDKDLNLVPNGAGTVKVPSGYKGRTGFVADSLVTKEYVDAYVSGLDVKESVSMATTVDLSTIPNGTVVYVQADATQDPTRGTLTSANNIEFNIDGAGITVVGTRVLVKDQTESRANGIYTLVQSGSGSAKWILARALDTHTPAYLTAGTFTFVEIGTVNADTGWIFTHDADPVVLLHATLASNTELPVTQFSSAGQPSAGAGIAQTGNVFSADTDNTTVGIVSTKIAVLSSGTQYQVLSATATGTDAATWGSLSLDQDAAVSGILAGKYGGTGHGGTSLIVGDTLFASSTSAWSKLAKGAAGQFLKMNSATTAPEWSDVVDGGTYGP